MVNRVIICTEAIIALLHVHSIRLGRESVRRQPTADTFGLAFGTDSVRIRKQGFPASLGLISSLSLPPSAVLRLSNHTVMRISSS